MINNIVNGMFGTLNGMEVIAAPNLPEFTPVIQLSSHVMVTDEFRAKTNAWYIEMFGQKRTAYVVEDKWVMHPNTIKCLQMQLRDYDL